MPTHPLARGFELSRPLSLSGAPTYLIVQPSDSEEGGKRQVTLVSKRDPEIQGKKILSAPAQHGFRRTVEGTEWLKNPQWQHDGAPGAFLKLPLGQPSFRLDCEIDIPTPLQTRPRRIDKTPLDAILEGLKASHQVRELPYINGELERKLHELMSEAEYGKIHAWERDRLYGFGDGKMLLFEITPKK